MRCGAVRGTVFEAWAADCQYVRGSITEIEISAAGQPTRTLGKVTGVLNGAVTAVITARRPFARNSHHQRNEIDPSNAPCVVPVSGLVSAATRLTMNVPVAAANRPVPP